MWTPPGQAPYGSNAMAPGVGVRRPARAGRCALGHAVLPRALARAAENQQIAAPRGQSDGQSATHLDVGRRYGLNKEWGIRVNGVYRDGDTALDYQEEMLGLATVGLDYHGKRVRTSLDIGYQAQDWDAPIQYLIYNGPAGKILRGAHGRHKSDPTMELQRHR